MQNATVGLLYKLVKFENFRLVLRFSYYNSPDVATCIEITINCFSLLRFSLFYILHVRRPTGRMIRLLPVNKAGPATSILWAL